MTEDDIFEVITRHAREVLPALQDHTFQRTDSLKALGANSIDRSEIVVMTLESLSLNLPLVETAKAQNITELAQILHRALVT